MPVTVVIATMDRRDNVLTTLDRLAALPERPPVVLVDNGSTDGTAEAVRRAHPEVVVLEPGRNLGAAGRTLGVEAARTGLVAFADDDSWWAPEGRLDPVCVEMADSPLPVQPDLPGPPVLGFIACGAVVRRSAYLAVGGFSPVVFFLGEETLLAQDLAAAGWGVAYVDDVVAHHHPGTAGDRTGRARLQARNALVSSWLRRPLPVTLRHTAAYARRSRSPVWRGALLDALRRLPAVVPERRVLPAEVERQVRLLETAAWGTA